MRLITLTLAGLLCGLPTMGTATVLLVDPSGGGDYTTIQPAIDAAATGDTVALVDHVYTGTGNRDLDMLGKAITVCSQSGNRDACIIDCQGSQSSPHRAFRLHLGEGPNTVIRELTIRNAYTTTGMGAISCEGASLTLDGCVLMNNHAQQNGGALGVSSPSSATEIRDCDFLGNSAAYGAAMVIFDGSDVNLTGCRLIENAGGSSGAVLCGLTSRLEIEGCLFEGNSAGSVSWSGALAFFDATEAVAISNCVFLANTSPGYGAVYIYGIDGPVVISNCTFWNNIGFPGAIACTSHGTLEVRGCTAVGNSSFLYAWDGPSVLVRDCNVAFNLGGSRFIQCSSVLVLCTNAYQNTGTDWYGNPPPVIGEGNINLDPLFCDREAGDFTLHANSPCADGWLPQCGLMGAWGVGCPATGVDDMNPTSLGSELRVVPNPTVGWCRIQADGDGSAAGPLEIFDPAGRLVRRVDAPAVGAADSQVGWTWDGLDERGQSAPSGIYLVRRSDDSIRSSGRIVLRR